MEAKVCYKQMDQERAALGELEADSTAVLLNCDCCSRYIYLMEKDEERNAWSAYTDGNDNVVCRACRDLFPQNWS